MHLYKSNRFTSLSTNAKYRTCHATNVRKHLKPVKSRYIRIVNTVMRLFWKRTAAAAGQRRRVRLVQRENISLSEIPHSMWASCIHNVYVFLFNEFPQNTWTFYVHNPPPPKVCCWKSTSALHIKRRYAIHKHPCCHCSANTNVANMSEAWLSTDNGQFKCWNHCNICYLYYVYM